MVRPSAPKSGSWEPDSWEHLPSLSAKAARRTKGRQTSLYTWSSFGVTFFNFTLNAAMLVYIYIYIYIYTYIYHIVNNNIIDIIIDNYDIVISNGPSRGQGRGRRICYEYS